MVEMTDLQARILTMIQAGFPLEREPYNHIGAACGCTAEEAFAVVQEMRAAKSIRRIGAVFDSAHLGYVSTLCAIAVTDPADVEMTAEVINSFPGVTHNYERCDHYNLWFTVIAPGQDAVEAILAEIAHRTGYSDILDLPAARLFKIRVDFNLTGEERGSDAQQAELAAAPKPNPRDVAAAAPEFSPLDRAVVRALQADLAAWERPFDAVAASLAEEGFTCSAEEVLGRARQWAADGTIRRFGAVVRHQKLGFAFNSMTVWDVPDEQAEAAGAIMAADPRVSHCYERPRRATWHANEYAMIHGKTEEACCAAAEELYCRLVEAGIPVERPRLLFSTREFKKRSMQYFCE